MSSILLVIIFIAVKRDYFAEAAVIPKNLSVLSENYQEPLQQLLKIAKEKIQLSTNNDNDSIKNNEVILPQIDEPRNDLNEQTDDDIDKYDDNNNNNADDGKLFIIRLLGDNLLKSISSRLSKIISNDGKDESIVNNDLLSKIVDDDNFKRSLNEFLPFIDEKLIDKFITDLIPNSDRSNLRQVSISVTNNNLDDDNDDVNDSNNNNNNIVIKYESKTSIGNNDLDLFGNTLMTKDKSDEFYVSQEQEYEDCDMSSSSSSSSSSEENESSAEKQQQTRIDAGEIGNIEIEPEKRYEVNFNGNAYITNNVYNIDYAPRTDIFISADDNLTKK